jgi:hypothetical protein
LIETDMAVCCWHDIMTRIFLSDPFDCGCGLAWLIRDNPALLPSVQDGVCGGFFSFEDLNPDSYANC